MRDMGYYMRKRAAFFFLLLLLTPSISLADSFETAIFFQQGHFKKALGAGWEVGKAETRGTPISFSLSQVIANRKNVTMSVSSAYILASLKPRGKRIVFLEPYLKAGAGGHLVFGYASLGEYGSLHRWAGVIKLHAILGAELLSYEKGTFFIETRYTFPSETVIDYFSIGARFNL